MPKFRVYFTTAASAVVSVEAEDSEAAIEAAYNELPSGVCAQCSGWGNDGPGIELTGDWEVDDDSVEEIGPTEETDA